MVDLRLVRSLVCAVLATYFGWAPPYAIGSVAMFWVIQRVAAF